MESTTETSPRPVEDRRSRLSGQAGLPVLHHSRRRGFFARILAALVIAAGMVKAIAFVAFDYMRGLAVDPCEGFGLTQFAVDGARGALSVAADAAREPRS